jgi:mannose-6-phosphate isomerase-like protein (cupin superfamily)
MSAQGSLEIVQTPLLKHAVGSRDTDFVVHEIQQDESPPGLSSRAAPLHLHRSEDEAWYVLEGTLGFQFGDREFDAPAGSGVLLPHGTPHTFWNRGPGPTRYLLIARPKTAALLESLHGPRRPPRGGLKELYSTFDIDLLE